MSLTIKVYSLITFLMCGLCILGYLSLTRSPSAAAPQTQQVNTQANSLISMEGLALEEKDKTQTYHLALQAEHSDYNQHAMQVTCKQLNGTISKKDALIGTFKAQDAIIMRKQKIIEFPGAIQGVFDDIVFESSNAAYDLTECFGTFNSSVACTNSYFTLTADSGTLDVKKKTITLQNNVHTIIEIPVNKHAQ